MVKERRREKEKGSWRSGMVEGGRDECLEKERGKTKEER